MPDAVVFVVGKGRVLYKGAPGEMNLARKRPMKDETIFRIASMTPLLSITPFSRATVSQE